ncbi:hypothetical protein BKA61DRAFT_572453 [Leptodontidium sp. MPI-SDFR-AT-0119]|nr:hypothetical protein BKA61DRAFT_572453 [Leptodontidium sp. MPI-SDFR-AT-0119]
MTIPQVDGNDRGAPQFGDALCASPLPLDARSFDTANIPEGEADVAETFVNEDSASDTIKILVSPLHKAFILHRVRICAISPYFSTIFSSASTLQVILPDIEPHTFQLAVDWLHHGTFMDDKNTAVKLDTLIDIYLFGDLIGCHTLKNYTMDLIQDDMYHAVRRGNPGIRFSLNQIRRIFTRTFCAENSPIRTFVAALVSYRLIFGDKPERLEPIFEVPVFLKDFAAFQRSSLKESDEAWYRPVSLREDPRVRGIHDVGVTRKGFYVCSFHVHEEGEKCSSVNNNGSEGGGAAGEDYDQQYCLEQQRLEDREGAECTNGEILR